MVPNICSWKTCVFHLQFQSVPIKNNVKKIKKYKVTSYTLLTVKVFDFTAVKAVFTKSIKGVKDAKSQIGAKTLGFFSLNNSSGNKNIKVKNMIANKKLTL
jgi:abortive infection bacteriophage resistance protein